MPKKNTRKAPSKKSSGLLVLVTRKIYLFIPVVAFLVGLGIFKSSLDGETSADYRAACGIQDLSGVFRPEEKIAYFDGQPIQAPTSIPSTLASGKTNHKVLGVTSEDRWIEVDLSEQKLIAHDGEEVYLETPVSSGLSYTPTPTGEFKIWYKLKATKMEGGEGKTYYYLPNVPYVMFFENTKVPGYKGYSLHGTYWHNDFGRQRSHGCVNLPTPVAEKLYYWVNPLLPDGKTIARATVENPGTRVVIHE